MKGKFAKKLSLTLLFIEYKVIYLNLFIVIFLVCELVFFTVWQLIAIDI